MGESVDNIISRENFWSKWKENKCFNYERAPMDKIKAQSEAFRKRDRKHGEKILNKRLEIKGLTANASKNGQLLLQILRMPSEQIDGPDANIKKGELPPLNDYMYPMC